MHDPTYEPSIQDATMRRKAAFVIQAKGGVAGSAAKNLQDAMLGVLRSAEPAALPWRPKLLKALTALGASEAALAVIDRLERSTARGQRWCCRLLRRRPATFFD